MNRPDLADLHELAQCWRIRRDSEGLPAIPGRRGHVSAHDLETLAVYVTGRRYLARVLRELPPGWRRHQIGDDEANLLAPLTDLDLACRVVRAYRRRRKTGGRDFAPRDHAIAGRFAAEIPAIVVTPTQTGAALVHQPDAVPS